MFYFKLAFQNIKNNRNVYLPFIIVTVVLYVTLCSNFLIYQAAPAGAVRSVLQMSGYILTILSFILVTYSYQFVLKQRTKEFGLYNVLGMSKKKVSLISNIEIIYAFIGLVILGNLTTVVFVNLIYLIFANLTQSDQLILTFKLSAFILTISIFILIFLVLTFVNLLIIGRISPLELFKTSTKAEKEPKGNIIIALVSIICLGVGYYLSLSSTKINSIALISRFFIAALFVIVGTYLFYISFITWYLRYKRKNKKYYYQPQHFIVISQMIFRMKQHAIGLANITLLAVMSFVTIATTSSLYGNTQHFANQLFPLNTQLSLSHQNSDKVNIESFAKQTIIPELKKSNSHMINYDLTIFSTSLPNKESITIDQNSLENKSLSSISFLTIITQNDFRSLGNSIRQLDSNETAFFVQKGNSQLKTANIFGKTYKNVKNFKKVSIPDISNLYNSSVLVVSDKSTVKTIQKYLTDYKIDDMGSYCIYSDLNDKDYQRLKARKGQWTNDKNQKIFFETKRKEDYLKSAYELFGGTLFVGLLLGFAFLMTVALIIYYKRYTEGFEDQKSYYILQEIGMSTQQIKKIIKSQTLTFFFLPLLLAVLHFIISLTLIKQILFLVGISNNQLIYFISAIAIIIIVVIYYLIYRLTGRQYYHLIER